MSRPDLRQRLRSLPHGPGVYIFRDAEGDVLYIGKAKALRDRVQSYFRIGGDGRMAVRFIEDRVQDIEVIVTRSEKEALLLENNLIKQQKPRFNIRLKDDKSYLHLRIDRKHPFPAIVPMRRPRKDGALYFGPYASARSIRMTLRLLREVFPLRDCSDHEFQSRTRPCLKYQIKMCSAPCVDYITREAYDADLEGAIRVLRGDVGGLIDALGEQMRGASERLEFERAGRLRDRISFLRNSTDVQAVESSQRVDRDVLGVHRRGRWVEISVLLFREGKLLSASPFSFETDLPLDEALSMFLSQFYGGGRPIPRELLVPTLPYASDTLQEWLEERRGLPVRIRVPRSGEGVRTLEMARRNAELSQQAAREQQSLSDLMLDEVRQRLRLRRVPRTIECIDISHLQGSHPVASLVRFESGEADKAGYRHFRIKTAPGGDDYAAMREVVRRRFGPRSDPEGYPDLLLVDGGKGQVNAVRGVLLELPLASPEREAMELAGIVKPPRRGRGIRLRNDESERIFRPLAIPGECIEIVLPPETESCYLLQRVRDEAHRFAIGYHRRLRSRGLRTSELEAVEGLGKALARRILRHFGGLRTLRGASREQLATIPGLGPTLAERLYEHLHPAGER